MPGQLQVRQGMWDPQVRSSRGDYITGEIRWGVWTDVRSPGWLFGYVLPTPQFVYEFRNAPEEG